MDVTQALQAWWAPGLAFAAGVVSFASPCVLPLVPGYLAFVAAQDPSAPRWATVVPTLLFVLGFAIVFTALGAFTSVFVPIFRSTAGRVIGGGMVALVGAFMVIYALRMGGAGLYAERRPFLSKIRPGPAGALPLGMAFAAGWTPCIGPILGGILSLSLANGGGARGALLMFSYSLGLGLPFLLVGFGVRWLTGALGVVKRNYRWIAGIGGALLMTIGVLVATNLWYPFLSRIGLLRLVRGFQPPL